MAHFFGDQLPTFLIVAAAVATALGVLWARVLRPVRDWFRSFKAWMHRIEVSVTWVEEQMLPNGGTTLVDKVNLLLKHDSERDTPGRRYGPSADDMTEGFL
jgi:hypothetical protein